MKNRARKKLFSVRRKLRSQFVRDTLRGLAEVKAGKLSRYCFNDEDRAWLDMVPVGREFKINVERTAGKQTLKEMLAAFDKSKHDGEVMAFPTVGKEAL